MQANRQTASWESDIWADCDGWKGSLPQDSHPLKALEFPSVDSSHLSQQEEKRQQQEEKRFGWIIELFLYRDSWLVRVTVTK